MNKKTYQQPVMKVVEIEEAAIIAQSGAGAPKSDGARFQDLEDGEFTW